MSSAEEEAFEDRNYRVDLESRLGKTQLVVTPVVAPGNYCSICVCVCVCSEGSCKLLGSYQWC